jgi:hypothetical protein
MNEISGVKLMELHQLALSENLLLADIESFNEEVTKLEVVLVEKSDKSTVKFYDLLKEYNKIISAFLSPILECSSIAELEQVKEEYANQIDLDIVTFLKSRIDVPNVNSNTKEKLEYFLALNRYGYISTISQSHSMCTTNLYEIIEKFIEEIIAQKARELNNQT